MTMYPKPFFPETLFANSKVTCSDMKQAQYVQHDNMYSL